MKRFSLFILLFGLLVISPRAVLAQERLTLSITPPLINNNVNPGQIWKSSIKVVNNNKNEVEISVQVVDFKGGTEDGTVEFLPSNEGDKSNNDLLSNWIVIEDKTFKIPAGQSKEIPFIIDVPKTAGPGGHYAAILTGTNPSEEKTQGSNVKISSLLASLILLNVSGEVKEDGRIREFSTDKKYYSEPKVNFTVRFENLGNVHIQPQGEIKIFNVWGKEKGAITINHNSGFGNVLPQGIRKWQFTWEGGKSLLEMGRYRAELVLSYGDKARQSTDQTLFFWIIYLKPLLIALGGILFFVLIIVISIRFYIRRAILKTQKEIGLIAGQESVLQVDQTPQIINDGNAVINLKNQDGEKGNVKKSNKKHYGKNVLTGLIIILLSLCFYFGWKWYSEKNNQADVTTQGEMQNISDANDTDEHIEVKENSDADKSGPASTTVNTALEEAITASSSNKVDDNKSPDDKKFVVKIMNGSGAPGVAAKAAALLDIAKFKVSDMGNADNFNYQKTMIIYKKDAETAIKDLNYLFANKTENEEVANQNEDIIIIIGSDFK